MRKKIDFEVGDIVDGAKITKCGLGKIHVGESLYDRIALRIWIEEGMIKYRKGRLSCKTHCHLWNDIDRDCEAYGDVHPCPRKCPIFKTRLYKKDGIK